MAQLGPQVLEHPGIHACSAAELTGSPELLTHDPLGGGFLALPGLEELLGQAAQRLGVARGIDGPVHALKFEFLAKAEGERFGHDELRGGTVLTRSKPPQSYEVFQDLAYPLRHP